MTTSKLSRATAMSAVLAGLLFIGIQFIHPVDEAASVTTRVWATAGYMTFGMAVLGLVGVSGIYLRQVREVGILGLAGYVCLGLFFLLTTAFTFAETLVLPVVFEAAPRFVDHFLGITNGKGTTGMLGALEAIGPLAGVLYTVGGMVFGIALFRSGILYQWAAILLAVGALVPLLTPFVGHSLARFAAVPVGVALVGLGFSLWYHQTEVPGADPPPRQR